ncbi:MAG: DHA2 family efflux MFS transporter permease subunit [Parvibaculum sp.]|uniref:DHA2 family efflux MFS transporter permease subunit n=1 Tax=Parvibaculum sp. TaxID=2024848 RepID=UPI002851465F|nr:DHA2 family efflux MFS transporter permease subunit [Parvibaculum sp.]MDR3500266.1 DHA2 family efflux MFS transporter permease subunit [Parvibaculum sp.]
MSSLDAAGAPDAFQTRRVVGFLFMVVGMFMAILDIQIVSSSITKIQAGLSASSDEISWVQTSYLIAEVVMIPMSGWLSRLMSTRYLYVASATGFTIMSFFCATATSIDQMIVYRALQGFLGGAMIPTVFASAYGNVFPPERRSSISVMIGLVATLAPTIGPTLGGYLTDAFSWHWLFLINIVPGAVVIVAVWLLVDLDEPNWSLFDDFDGWGALLMAVFLGSLEYVLEEGPRNDWFNDDTIWWLGVVCFMSGSFFFARVLTDENPIVDLRAYMNRNFALGSVLSIFLGVALYGLTYLYPLFLAQVRHLSALQIGEIMAVTGICQFVSAPIAGILTQKVDIRYLIGYGFGMLALSNYLTLGITWEWDYGEFLLPQAIRGLGLMFCIVPINALALGTLPQSQLKNASGLYNLMRNLGGAIGLAIINTVLVHRLDFHKSRLREAVEAGRPVIDQTVTGLGQMIGGTLGSSGDLAAIKELYGLMTREATVMAFADCFFVLAICFAAMLLTLPMVDRPQVPGGSGGGH